MEPRLSVGDALSEVFRIYREQAGVLLPVAFWLFLVVAIVNGLTEGNISLFWIGLVVSLAVGTSTRGWWWNSSATSRTGASTPPSAT